MSLFSALSATANSLSAFENALTVTQNNINNSSTPGYAAQEPTFEALPFQQGTDESGGVESGTPTDTRDSYVEQSVQSSSSQAGLTQQQVQDLTSLQNLFDISGQTGIPNALSGMYSAFSNWASSPNSTTDQQGVISAATSVAKAFQQTASQVSQVAATTTSSLSSEVSQVNALAAQLSGYNSQIEAGDKNDPGLSAQIYNTLQQLSQLANISTVGATNGTITVLLGNGQTPLVNGSTANVLGVSVYVPQPPPPANPNGPPTAHIVTSSGTDVTSEITGGQLGGSLNTLNSVLPSIQGDGNTTGTLNQLAKSFADKVNDLLTNGVVSAGPPVVNGTALFTYDSTNATNTAASLAVNPAITTGNLAAADSSTSNGTALALAGLENSTKASASSLSAFANANSTAVSATGSMQLVVGSNQYPITLTAAQNNLQGLVSAINTSGAPVSASIITTSAGNYLSVSATSPGATTLQLNDDPSGANKNILTAPLNGQTYSGYFGTIAAGVGTDLSNATSAQTEAQDSLTQAESVRQQVSGVDLNQQATQVLQFQQAYDAASKVISVIDQMTQDAISIIQASQIV